MNAVAIPKPEFLAKKGMSLIPEMFLNQTREGKNGRGLSGVQDVAHANAWGEKCELPSTEGYLVVVAAGPEKLFFLAAAIRGRRASTEMPRVPPEKPSM